MGIEPYLQINLNKEMLGNEQAIQSLFSLYADKALPQTDLHTIQESLLLSAPFPLKEEFRPNNCLYYE